MSVYLAFQPPRFSTHQASSPGSFCFAVRRHPPNQHADPRLPFCLQSVVWKVVALFVFYIIFFPHLIFELRDRRLRTDTKVEAGAGERGGNVGWQIYKMAAGYLLFTPVYAFIIGIAAPVTHLLW